MRTYKDIGIPFKQFDLSEADKILSILTRYHGRVDCIAKGIRKINSKKAGNIDIMSKSKFKFAKGRNLDIITEAELLDDFGYLKTQLESTFNLFFICELLDKFLQKEQEEREIFQLLDNLLKILPKDELNISVHSFTLKLLKNQGFEPNIYACDKCGNKLNADTDRFLTQTSIGFVCANEKNRVGKAVSDRIVKTIKFLKDQSLKNSLKLEVSGKEVKNIEDILKNWVEIVIEKQLESKKIKIS